MQFCVSTKCQPLPHRKKNTSKSALGGGGRKRVSKAKWKSYGEWSLGGGGGRGRGSLKLNESFVGEWSLGEGGKESL